MKLIMENWKKYLKEGEVVSFPGAKSPMDTAIDEFVQIFSPQPGDDGKGEFIDPQTGVVMDKGYNFSQAGTWKPWGAGTTPKRAKTFMQHLETKEVDAALNAIGYWPNALEPEQRNALDAWVDKWFDKKQLMEALKVKISKTKLQQIISEELEMVLLEEGVMDWFRSKPDLSQITLDEPRERWSLEQEMEWDPHRDLLLPSNIKNKIARIRSNYEAETGQADLDIMELLEKTLKSRDVEPNYLSVENDVLTWRKESRSEITSESPGYGSQFDLGDIFIFHCIFGSGVF